MLGEVRFMSQAEFIEEFGLVEDDHEPDLDAPIKYTDPYEMLGIKSAAHKLRVIITNEA